jgi:hypothetical protein
MKIFRGVIFIGLLLACLCVSAAKSAIPHEFQTEIHKIAFECEKNPSFSIELPRGWKKAETERVVAVKCDGKNLYDLGVIAKYNAPDNNSRDSSFVVIEIINPEKDISLRNWFRDYLRLNKFRLRKFSELSHSTSEALYERQTHSRHQVVRTLARAYGSRIILVSYYSSQKSWYAEKSLQEMVIKSFQIIQLKP